MKLLIATHNSGKKREFLAMLSSLFTHIDEVEYPTSFEVVEDADSFRANAIKKAVEATQAFGVVSIVDDSGLEVDALDGKPGIYSARFAGENASDADNNALLIRSLAGQKNRKARYVAEVVVAFPEKEGMQLDAGIRAKALRQDGLFLFCGRGTCEGEIIDTPRGEKGFGYDPYFLIPDWGLTMAEVSMEKKASISHRSRALKEIQKLLSSQTN